MVSEVVTLYAISCNTWYWTLSRWYSQGVTLSPMYFLAPCLVTFPTHCNPVTGLSMKVCGDGPSHTQPCATMQVSHVQWSVQWHLEHLVQKGLSGMGMGKIYLIVLTLQWNINNEIYHVVTITGGHCTSNPSVLTHCGLVTPYGFSDQGSILRHATPKFGKPGDLW